MLWPCFTAYIVFSLQEDEDDDGPEEGDDEELDWDDGN